VQPFMGVQMGLKAFVAAVLGGIGNIYGAIFGGLLVGIAETMVVGYLASSYRDGIVFAILIVVLLVKPTGLFGSPVTDRA
ncbi:MAG: branched-chain amino acid ABC transporter permease, partial [Armatimonadota bacterium]